MIDISNYSIFTIEFHTKATIGRLVKDCNDEIVIHVNEFEVTLCDLEDFNEFVEIKELREGKQMTIDGVDVIIDAIDVETHEESNLFWEKVEMEEMNHL